MIGRGELRGGGGGGGGEDVNSILNTCFLDLLQLLRGFCTEKIIKKKKQTKQNKNGKVLNKPQMRLLLKISGGSRYVYRYIFGKKNSIKKRFISIKLN